MRSYRIALRTHLSTGLHSVLPMATQSVDVDTTGRPITLLTINVADQSELIGLLTELHDIGIQLVAINALENGEGGQSLSS